MEARYEEHIDERGILRVPVAKMSDPTPRRPGWRPWWVNIVGGRNPEKIISYKPETDTAVPDPRA